MKVLRTEPMAVADMRLPTEDGTLVPFMEHPIWKTLLYDDSTIERGRSIVGHEDGTPGIGQLHEPIVRMRDGRVASGRSRIVGQYIHDVTSPVVKLVDASDAEMERIELEENEQRRHDPAFQRELTLRRLALIERDVKARPKRQPPGKRAPQGEGVQRQPPMKRGREKTPRAEARAALAAERGVSPEAIRRQEYRAKKAKGEVETRPRPRSVTTPGPVVLELGMEPQQEFLAQMAAIQGYLKACLGKLRTAAGELTKLASAELPVETGKLDRLRDQLKSLTAKVGALSPKSLCPYCKGLAGLQETCTGCGGLGYVCDLKGVPKELLDDAAPLVVAGGKVVTVEDYLDSLAEQGEDLWGDE